MRILVVEDEQKIANSIKRGLETQSYAVDVAYDGEVGCNMALGEPYDLIILDRMLPGMDGLLILQKVRKNKINTPVLFLTAKDKILDRAAGLNNGADDYLVKPFAFVELIARVRALLRRPANVEPFVLEYDGLTMDSISHMVSRGGTNIELTQKEYALHKDLKLRPQQTHIVDSPLHHQMIYALKHEEEILYSQTLSQVLLRIVQYSCCPLNVHK